MFKLRFKYVIFALSIIEYAEMGVVVQLPVYGISG